MSDPQPVTDAGEAAQALRAAVARFREASVAPISQDLIASSMWATLVRANERARAAELMAQAAEVMIRSETEGWTVIGVWQADEIHPAGAVRGRHQVQGGDDSYFPEGCWAAWSGEAEVEDAETGAMAAYMQENDEIEVVRSPDLVARIVAYEAGELTDEADIVGFFQELVDTDVAWSLQGSYGRQAAQFIEAGLVRPKAAGL